MKIIEKKMDLFKLPLDYTLVHCISQDCAIGRGIAKIFNKKYANMKTKLLKIPRRMPSALLYTVPGKANVINMITKENYWNKPTYDNFHKSLKEVKMLCIKNHIKKLGMPKIGCGLDKLEWDKVRTIIQEEFEDLDIEIVVCYL